jgi:hypothetical protein
MQILISNPNLQYQPTFLNSVWFDDATGAIAESCCGPWGLILGSQTHWEENVKFLATEYTMYLASSVAWFYRGKVPRSRWQAKPTREVAV